MVTFNWKILETTIKDESITHVKYYVSAVDGNKKVETEGNAFGDFSFGINFKDITEQNVIETLKKLYVQGESNLIELNLKQQLENLSVETVSPPWHVDTFKVEV